MVWGSGLGRGLIICRLLGDLKAWEFTDSSPHHQITLTSLHPSCPRSIKTVCCSRTNSRCQTCHSLGSKLNCGIGYVWLQKRNGTFSREKREKNSHDGAWELKLAIASEGWVAGSLVQLTAKDFAQTSSPWGALCSCGPPTLVQGERLPGAAPMSQSPWQPLDHPLIQRTPFTFQTCTPPPFHASSL